MFSGRDDSTGEFPLSSSSPDLVRRPQWVFIHFRAGLVRSREYGKLWMAHRVMLAMVMVVVADISENPHGYSMGECQVWWVVVTAGSWLAREAHTIEQHALPHGADRKLSSLSVATAPCGRGNCPHHSNHTTVTTLIRKHSWRLSPSRTHTHIHIHCHSNARV
jgi:hypothetical protein